MTTWSAHGEALDLGADLDDLGGRLVPEGSGALAGRDAAVAGVHGIGAADAARAHAQQHIAGADLRLVDLDPVDLVHTGDVDGFHGGLLMPSGLVGVVSRPLPQYPNCVRKCRVAG